MLIDREKVLDRTDKLYQSSAMTGLGLEPVLALRDIKALISVETEVDAVPLDKLCALLGKNADCPPEHSPVQDHCKENCAECWKSVLKEWMEEQDEQKEANY